MEYARGAPTFFTCLRALISSFGIQMHNASLTISAGCMVNTPGMPIHPLLPLTSTPNGVSVAACMTMAPSRNQKLIFR